MYNLHPHGAMDGALNGATVGMFVGILVWGVIKLFKLEGYLGGKKTPPSPPTTSVYTMPPQETNAANAWSGGSAHPPPPVLGYDVPTPAPTQATLIAVMWILTALGFVVAVFLHIANPILIFLDLPAIVIAIILLCRRNAISRWNGGAKLGLELIAFVVAFVAAIRFLPGLSTPEPMPAFPIASPIAPAMPGRIVPPPQFAPPPVAPQNLPMSPHFGGPPMPSLPH